MVSTDEWPVDFTKTTQDLTDQHKLEVDAQPGPHKPQAAQAYAENFLLGPGGRMS